MMARPKPKVKMDFVAFKSGWSLKITPQTPRGWKFMGAWLAILLVPVAPFGAFATIVDNTPNEHWAIWATIPFLAVTGVLIWIMTRWLIARSEIVDLADVADWKRDKAHNGE